MRTSMGTTGFSGNEEEAESPDPLGMGGALLSASNLSRLMIIGPGLKGSSGGGVGVGVGAVMGVTLGVAEIVVGVADIAVVGLFSSFIHSFI